MKKDNKLNKELQALKQKAKKLGITFHPNIGLEKLQAKIDALATPEQKEIVNEKPESEMTEGELRVKKTREANKLVRCMITTNDPSKAELYGEIITGQNSYVAEIKKFVPYNTGVPFHLPKILFNILDEKTYTQHYEVKDEKGNMIKKTRQAKAYNLEILDPITPEELEEIKHRQANTIDEE